MKNRNRAMNDRASWTDVQDAQLLGMRAQGIPWTTIGSIMERTAPACCNRHAKLTSTSLAPNPAHEERLSACSERLREKMLSAYARHAVKTGATLQQAMLSLLYGADAAARHAQSGVR